MTLAKRLWLSLGLLGIALVAIQAKTDRIFNNLTPTQGQMYVVSLSKAHVYSQTFTTPRTDLSKVGLFLVPLQRSLPASPMSITIRRQDQVVGTTQVIMANIPREGAMYATFKPTLATQPGETLALDLTVPASGLVGLQVRQPDETFDASSIPFTIDDQIQPRPMALELYAHYRPSFMIAIGVGLVILVGLLLSYPYTWPYRGVAYGLCLTVACLIPSWLSHHWSILLAASVVVAATGMLWLLHWLRFQPVAAVCGANVFALTTWFTLQSLAGRQYLLFVAALPYVVLAITAWRQGQKRVVKQTIVITLTWLIVILLFGHHQETSIPWQATANVKDIFIDPYQITAAQKSLGAAVPWDNFGSYIGVINSGLVLLGLLWQVIRRWRWLVTGCIALAMSLVPTITHLFSWLPTSPQHLIIITTFCLSYFAAWGMEGLLKYLGHSRLTTCLTWGIATLAVLDLFYVWATVLEFKYL